MRSSDVVLVAPTRTPIGVGRPDRGELAGVHPVDLSAVAIEGTLARAGVSGDAIQDVVWGCVTQAGEQALNIGRNAALAAGLPEAVPGMTVDRQCGSSQQAIEIAGALVASGYRDVVIAGGVESMSRAPMFSAVGEADGYGKVHDRYSGGLVPQGLSAELLAERWSLGRVLLDEFAVESHRRAHQAQVSGAFDDEITAAPTSSGPVVADQGIRAGSTPESLARLKPAFRPDGVITAGNASQISDGAAAVVVTRRGHADQLGLDPVVRIRASVAIGVDPILMLHGPIMATQQVLERASLTLGDIGAFEINEAFAPVVEAWFKDTGAPRDLTNVLGGAIALGHPMGASGCRITATLAHLMRRNGIRYGLQTMCEGGGMANATIYELVT